MSALDSEWLFAGFGLLLLGVGLFQYGSVEVNEDEVVLKRIVASVSVPRDDIAQISLANYQQKRTKYWYPFVETYSGDHLKLTSVASTSQQNAMNRINELISILGATGSQRAGAPDPHNPIFASGPATAAAPAPEPDPMEFNLTPGYDAYLREKAEEEAAALAAAAAGPTPPPPPAAEPAQAKVVHIAPQPAAEPSNPVVDPNAPIEWPNAA